jgi:hypothetical protein
MKTYLIIKNDVVIAKRKAENCLDAMKKWCKTIMSWCFWSAFADWVGV